MTKGRWRLFRKTRSDRLLRCCAWDSDAQYRGLRASAKEVQDGDQAKMNETIRQYTAVIDSAMFAFRAVFQPWTSLPHAFTNRLGHTLFTT